MTTTLGLLHGALILVAATVPSGTVTETRPVTAFDSIVLRGIGDLELQQGAKESLAVVAEARLMPKISTTVRNGTLYLEVVGSVSTQMPLRYEVTAPTVKSIRSEGSGRIAAGALNGERLEIAVSGSGDARIDAFQGHALATRISGSASVEIAGGRADTQTIKVNGSGSYDGAGFDTAAASVAISGSGDVELRARERLDVRIAGSGAVRYHGNPVVRKSITGSGDVSYAGR